MSDEAKKKVAEALKLMNDLPGIPGVPSGAIDEWIQATRSFLNELGACWDPDLRDYVFHPLEPAVTDGTEGTEPPQS
jgi:hypothetical protein